MLFDESEEEMRVSLRVLSEWCREWLEEFKYLGCVVTEQMVSKRMVGERARAGSRALSDWLRKCRDAAGEVRRTFVRLMEMLVGSVLLYVVEVWGGGGQLEPVVRVQMRAARSFLRTFTARRHHPST